jgi:hypothetical protein
MTQPDSQRVARLVREYLKNRRPDGVTLEVDEPGIRKEPYWWSVPVRPSSEPSKRYEYYETLAEVEEEIEEQEQLKVFLVPSDAIEPAELTTGT